MHGVGTLEGYLAHPVGPYLWGPTFVVWWSSGNLNGVTFWGRPEEEHRQPNEPAHRVGRTAARSNG